MLMCGLDCLGYFGTHPGMAKSLWLLFYLFFKVKLQQVMWWLHRSLSCLLNLFRILNSNGVYSLNWGFYP